MQLMTWSMGLESKASTWVSTCPSGHNPVQTDPSNNNAATGENMYFSWVPVQPTSFDPSVGTAAVDSWFSEVKDFSSSNINPYSFSSNTGHYTQVEWATSTTVGCGVVLCKDSS